MPWVLLFSVWAHEKRSREVRGGGGVLNRSARTPLSLEGG